MTQNRTTYRSNAGTLLVFTGTTPEDGEAFFGTVKEVGGPAAAFYLLQVSNLTDDGFDVALPQLNTSGWAKLESDGNITWNGWRYHLLREPFQGELTLAKEDKDAPRIGTHLLFARVDGRVVYISRNESGSPAGYRVFIGQVSPDGGTLSRVTIRKCIPIRNGSVRIDTEDSFIDTESIRWRALPNSEYDITETDSEVEFRKK